MKKPCVAWVVLAVLCSAVALAQNPNDIFRSSAPVADKALAAKGNVTATMRLGYRYLTGAAGTIDPVEAYQYFAKAASNSLAASAWLGFVVATTPELAGSGVDGVGLVRQAASAGDPVGMTLYGRLLELGQGVP